MTGGVTSAVRPGAGGPSGAKERLAPRGATLPRLSRGARLGLLIRPFRLGVLRWVGRIWPVLVDGHGHLHRFHLRDRHVPPPGGGGFGTIVLDAGAGA